MSQKANDSLSRGQMSITIGTPAEIGPEPMSCPTAPCGPGATMKSSAVQPFAAKVCDIAFLTRSTVSGSPSRTSPVPFCSARRKQVACSVHPGLGGTLGAAHAGELRLRLHAAAVVEELAVDGQLDAVGAQLVGEPERERLRDDGLRDAERRDRAQRDLVPDLGIGLTLGDQVVEPVLLARVQLEQSERREARDLHRADRDVLDPVLLDVEERVRDAERHLVPKLGRTKGVSVHEDVWHGADSN